MLVDHVVAYGEANAAQVFGKCHQLVELNFVLATEKNGGCGQDNFLDDPQSSEPRSKESLRNAGQRGSWRGGRP